MTIRGHRLNVGTFTSAKAGKAYGALAFLYTLNQNIPSSGFNTLSVPGWTVGQRLQSFFIGVPVLRFTGSSFLMPPGTYNPGRLPITFTFNKALNNVFYLGLGLALYGIVAPMIFKAAPFAGAARRVGVPIAVGGFVGGGFDPDPPGATVFPSASASVPLMSAAPGAGQPAQGSFSDSVRF